MCQGTARNTIHFHPRKEKNTNGAVLRAAGPMYQLAARNTIHFQPREKLKKDVSSSFAVFTNKFVRVGIEDTAKLCKFEMKCVYEKTSTKENCAYEKKKYNKVFVTKSRKFV